MAMAIDKELQNLCSARSAVASGSESVSESGREVPGTPREKDPDADTDSDPDQGSLNSLVQRFPGGE
jgi:hypothetical protein